MTGKQIAENLRNNREKWTRYRYHEDGKYCVIGLKLMEMGVKVEEWPVDKGGDMVALLSDLTAIDPHGNLTWLQQKNDSSNSVDDLISWADMHGDTEFPVEALAAALKPA